MASLAQKHKPRLVQVLVICLELVVDIEVVRPCVVLAAELTGLVPRCKDIFAEDLPLGSSTKSLVLLFQYFVIVEPFHIYIVANCVAYKPHWKLLYYAHQHKEYNMPQVINPPIPQTTQPMPEPTVEVKPLRPARTEYFKNDLTDADKESVIELVVQQTRATLAEDRVTINAVARMFGIEHNKVKQASVVNDSLKFFIETRDKSKNMARLTRAISKLTPEEKSLLALQLGAK